MQDSNWEQIGLTHIHEKIHEHAKEKLSRAVDGLTLETSALETLYCG